MRLCKVLGRLHNRKKRFSRDHVRFSSDHVIIGVLKSRFLLVIIMILEIHFLYYARPLTIILVTTCSLQHRQRAPEHCLIIH